MHGSIPMKWAMVCSVPDKKTLDQLREFGCWFCEALQNEANDIGVTHQFDPQPEVVFHAIPGNYAMVIDAYTTIAEEYPAVMFILQILPSQKSQEYVWMKSLTNRFGKIRQGVALENAQSRFAGLDLHEVLTNILHWISRRVSQLISHSEADRPFDLRVGPSDDSTIAVGHTLRMNGVESAVQTVLHSYETDEREWPVSSVKITGFPSVLNQYQLASIFYNFTVNAVHFEENYAIVCFANKFHAVQAAALFDRLQLDAEHVLRVTPTCELLKEQVSVSV